MIIPAIPATVIRKTHTAPEIPQDTTFKPPSFHSMSLATKQVTVNRFRLQKGDWEIRLITQVKIFKHTGQETEL